MGVRSTDLCWSKQPGSIDKPVKELKVQLISSEKQSISVLLDDGCFAYFSEEKGKWSVDAGKYIVYVGVTSAHIVARKLFSISALFEFNSWNDSSTQKYRVSPYRSCVRVAKRVLRILCFAQNATHISNSVGPE